MIIFHLVTEGRGYACVEHDRCPMPFEAGDIVMFPHGDAHLLGNGPPVRPINSADELKRILREGFCPKVSGAEN
ncbi:MAG: cupin domain-containing protein [Nitrospira sp.]|nr:cupin domain-containing protein [Nitrospira sp.]